MSINFETNIKNSLHRNMLVSATFAAAILISGCSSTLEGAGKDAKSAGKAIEKTADDVKKKL